MRELYTEEGLAKIHGQLKRRVTWVLVIFAVFLAVGIWSMIIRLQLVTTAAIILMGAVLIFGLEMFCRPIWQYEKLVRSALRGRTHTENFVFDHQEQEASLVDGVNCISLVFLGEPDKHGTRDQLFYWDQFIPLPVFTAGETYPIKYTGKNIIGYGSPVNPPFTR